MASSQRPIVHRAARRSVLQRLPIQPRSRPRSRAYLGAQNHGPATVMPNAVVPAKNSIGLSRLNLPRPPPDPVVDVFLVPTLTFRLLFVFVVLRHDRRERSTSMSPTIPRPPGPLASSARPPRKRPASRAAAGPAPLTLLGDMQPDPVHVDEAMGERSVHKDLLEPRFAIWTIPGTPLVALNGTRTRASREASRTTAAPDRAAAPPLRRNRRRLATFRLAWFMTFPPGSCASTRMGYQLSIWGRYAMSQRGRRRCSSCRTS